jgi:hypothetical protein
MNCHKLTVKATMVNENPVGFRSLALDSINNAKITFVDPASPSQFIGKTKTTFEVVAINPLRNASAIIILTDRTNKTWRIHYNYEAEYLNVIPDHPAVLDFDGVTLNIPERRKIILTNPLQKDVQIRRLFLVQGDQGFTIIKPEASQLPITLKSNESLEIEVEITPTIPNHLYEDSVKAELICSEAVGVKVQAAAVTAGVAGSIESGTALTRIDPNPFHGTTRIEFMLGTAGHATLEVFAISGRRVATLADGEMQPGAHTAAWDASHLPAGTYYCRLTVGEWSTTETLIVR